MSFMRKLMKLVLLMLDEVSQTHTIEYYWFLPYVDYGLTRVDAKAGEDCLGGGWDQKIWAGMTREDNGALNVIKVHCIHILICNIQIYYIV